MLTYTSEMRRSMEGISFEDDDFIEKIIGIGKRFRPFSEAMDAFILAHGYTGDIHDTAAKVGFIRKAFTAAGMKPPREAEKWYDGQPISRRTGFRICFAFGLGKTGADDFFRRIFARERGFDCHNPEEAVCYYCLSNGLTSADAAEIMERIRDVPGEARNNREVVYTGSIIEDLDSIRSKEELILYLQNNIGLFAENNMTAYRTIRKMWEMTTEEGGLLQQESRKLYSIQDDLSAEQQKRPALPSGMSISEAFIAILQLNREQVSRLNSPKSVRPILAELHSHIRDSFPNEQGIAKILRGDHSLSYESVRKWLVLLSFYTFWARLAVYRPRNGNYHYDADPEDRERCAASMNSYLVEAGYSTLYEGNPYDWLFFYAIGDETPLPTFRWIWTFLTDRALENERR